MNHPPILAIICPCYNEAEGLHNSMEILKKKLNDLKSKNIIADKSFLCLVDDGSEDDSWSIMSQYCERFTELTAIKLIVNVGHQNALTAGLHHVTDLCDCCITIDIDLQDDIEVFEQMIHHYLAGSHIVYGVRTNRDSDSLIKRGTAQLYYKLLKILGVKTIYNHADFRLCSDVILRAFKAMPERNLYLRGIFANFSCRTDQVFYARKNRLSGKTKYTLAKMISLAWNGISSFSIVPLRLITLLGFIIFIFSSVLTLYVLWIKFFTDFATPGWASTLLSIYLLGGLQFLALGILGEYIAKIFLEIKQRPRYIIETVLNHNKNQL